MFATAQHNLSGGATYGMASHGDDKGLYVEFENRAVQIPFLSEREGRPIFEEQAFITIHFPGDKTKRVERPVKMKGDDAGPSDPERFPRQWQAFKNQEAQSATGTPITEWPPLTKSQAMELKALNILTVEGLAAMPDTACSWLGSRELRDKAKTWLESVNDHSAEARLQLELKQRDATISAMQVQLDDLAARLSEKSAADADTASTRAARAPRRAAATTQE